MACAAADIDTKELELCIKGFLISRPTVVKANWLQRECEEELGKPFPLRQLGFSTFVEYLKSIPNVVQLEPRTGYNPDVYPVASKASSHIDQLVSKQRVPPSRKRGVARRGSYSSRQPVAPPRRRPSRPVPGTNSSVFRSNQIIKDCVQAQRPQPFSFYPSPRSRSTFCSHNFSIKMNIHKVPSSGINVRDLERDLRRNYDERDLSRNRIHGVDDLLSHAEGMVERADTQVYPQLAGGFNNTDQRYQANSIPAGLEDEFDDFDTDNEFYDERGGRDSEEEMSNEAIRLWSKALDCEKGNSSPRLSETEGNVYNSREETLNQSEQIPEEDDSNISRGMINNFRKILNKNLDGIWASELQKLYFEEFRVTLDFLDLGYTSAIALVSSLPSVFSFQRVESHDWKLYDARYISQASIDAQGNRANNSSLENERYIPQTIIEKIKMLLDDNPNGFRSTDLLAKYEETFRKPLDLDVLGFNTLDEFLPILKNDITLKKVLNYFLLLPKHRIMPLEALEPPKPDERLKISAEALCVPIPENVMTLGDEIPLQKLPTLQDDPEKPLMELVVRVAEVMSPVLFYMTLDSTHEELESMMDDLHKYYEWEGSAFQIPLPHLATNLYCAAKYCDGYWHRARITRMRNDGDVEIEFIDYGTPVTMKPSELRYLSKEFTTLPVQAICAKLAGLKPLNGQTRFPKEVCETFLRLVEAKRLYAYVYSIESRMGRNTQEKIQMALILYDVDNRVEEIVINDYLVENGFASPILEIQDSAPTMTQSVDDLSVNNLISHQTISSATSVPLSTFPLFQEDGATSNMESDTSSVFGSRLPSHPRTGTTLSASSIFTLLKRVLNEKSVGTSSPPSPRTCSLPVHWCKNSTEEKKPRGPPPGFEAMFPGPDFNISTPLPSASQPLPSSSESRPSTYVSTEQEQKVFINNYYLMNPKELYPKLLMQEQYLPQNVYRPNPSNMPFVGAPLVQQPQQNRSGRTLTYGSFLPPQYINPNPSVYRQQEYHTASSIPNNYFPSAPVPNNLLLMNNAVPANLLLVNNPVSNPYYAIYPSPHPNFVGNVTSKVQNYGGDFALNQPSVNPRFSSVQNKHTSSPSSNATTVQSYGGDVLFNPPPVNHGFSPVQARHTPSPSLIAANVQNYGGDFSSNPPSVNPVHTRLSPVQARQTPSPSSNATLTHAPTPIAVPVIPPTPVEPSPATPYTPITVPEWPPKNLPVFCNSSFTETKIVPSDQLSVPASTIKFELTETTQIRRPSTPLTPGSTEVANICKHGRTSHTNSQNQMGSCDNLQINKSPATDFTTNSQVNTNTSDNATSLQSEDDRSKTNSGSLSDEQISSQQDIDVSAIILPAVKEISQTTSSPETLYSEANSGVECSVSTTPTKEESSDDYASASENIEEAKRQVVNSTVPESSEPFDESNKDIPDSWESLDLDETPARAENFEIDISQRIELVNGNINYESSVKSNIPDVDESVESPLKSQISPPLTIQAPVNWKDMFDPDAKSCTERINNNNNEVKENSLNLVKFDVKKIPVQKLEIQGKFFHLVNVNNVPAVLPQEFFKQFGSGINPAVAVKILEVNYDKFYNISSADHPAILFELNKVVEFCGGVKKKTLIRLNKASVINLSEIPRCLAVLNVPNKSLLEDLKKIINEFKSF